MAFVTPVEAHASIQAAHARIAAVAEPAPDIAPSVWGEQNIYLRKGTTPRPGPLRLEKYQRDMVDVFADPEVHEVVCVKPTQIGWSVVLNILSSYTVVADPKPFILVQPTADNAKDYGRKRINPLIEDCPALKERIRKSKSRKGGNTLKLKEFPGGFLKLAGANAATDLRSDPVPVVLMDERDGYPEDVNGEGEPGEIVRNRTEAFPDWKILEGGTPAKPKGLGRLEKQWLKSDQRRFHVACPHCAHEQVLWWRDPVSEEYRLVYETDHNGDVIPSSVQYVCVACKRGISERHKQAMIDGGRWIAAFPERAIVGFHINALYRPWKESWASLAQKWVDAQGDREKLKEFITLQLAEFWEEAGERVDAANLITRREAYPTVPGAPEDSPRRSDFEILDPDVAVVTCAFDVQENRIEGVKRAWAAGERSWLVAHEVFWGNPATEDSVWEAADTFRLSEHLHASGTRLRAVITLVDSGDNTDAVYDYVEPRQNLRDCVFASKGVPYHSKPVLVQDGTTKRSGVRLFTIDTNAAKERIMARLKIIQPGPGYMHFPIWATQEYFDQLTSEKKLRVTDKRTRVKKTLWVKTHTRNEALDLEVGNLAALFVLQKILDPATFGDLAKLAAMVRGEEQWTARRGRRVRSTGAQL